MAPDFFAQHLVPVERIAEAFKLLASGQLPPNQKVGGLDKATVLGQLLDGNTAVAEDALFSINEGDGALAGSRVAESIIQGDVAALASQGTDIDRSFGLAADNNRQVNLFLA